MTQDEIFFIEECVRHARTLKYLQCLSFLRGLLFAIGEHEGAAKLRLVVQQMAASDAQLDLIQIGQLRLGMDAIKPAAPPEVPGSQTKTEGSEGAK